MIEEYYWACIVRHSPECQVGVRQEPEGYGGESKEAKTEKRRGNHWFCPACAGEFVYVLREKPEKDEFAAAIAKKAKMAEDAIPKPPNVGGGSGPGGSRGQPMPHEPDGTESEK